MNAQITTGWVDIAGMTAYTALPVGTRRPVGVLVAGEIFGVSRYARRMPDRLAGLGHVVCSVAGELGLSAAVALYPGWLTGTDLPLSRPEPTLEPAARAPGRLVVLLGADDPIIDARQQEAIGERLETVVYPGAGHGFAADERDSFHPASAREAWRLIEEVLDQVRRSPQTAG
ncbi:dienelactone hydrolase family protein [Nonomuraea sp. NPDC051191]|uniref:dienelactone hydrolase family protein n=1 Tax=Nonomuraea sp. NPDC051191 TaxID=3364372 RepID=UPI00379BEEFB